MFGGFVYLLLALPFKKYRQEMAPLMFLLVCIRLLILLSNSRHIKSLHVCHCLSPEGERVSVTFIYFCPGEWQNAEMPVRKILYLLVLQRLLYTYKDNFFHPYKHMPSLLPNTKIVQLLN